MAQHPIRKFFGLTVLYACIILGIFAIQFTSQTIFSRNFGQLRLLLSETKKENTEYADTFQVSLKGITFFSDKNNRIELIQFGNQATPLVFTDWKQHSDYDFELLFSSNVSVRWHLGGQEHTQLSVSVRIPDGAHSVRIPYKTAGTHTLTELTGSHAVFRSKEETTLLSAPEVLANRIIFYPAQAVASYMPQTPELRFTFAAAVQEQLAALSVADVQVKQFRAAIVSSFLTAPDITETTVAAYIAEMAQMGKYTEAVANIPSSYKSGKHRTYLTAPALDNLTAMNRSLVMRNDNLAYKASHAAERNDAGIFEAEYLAEYLLRTDAANAERILAIPANTDSFLPTLSQAAGILETYNSLRRADTRLAERLLPGIAASLSVIESSCTAESGGLYLYENQIQSDMLLAIRTGAALETYGTATGDRGIAATGRLLVVTQLQQHTFDALSAGNAYAKLVKNNTFYPHEVILEKQNGNCIWAWTIAQSVSLKRTDHDLTVSTEFPQDGVHYMILNGIEPFEAIEIYNIRFRSDPRFETYNSSGYVYDRRTKTLFLKYRHKERIENVRLIYREEPAASPAAPAGTEPIGSAAAIPAAAEQGAADAETTADVSASAGARTE